MRRVISILLLTLVLATVPATAEGETCQDGKTRIQWRVERVIVSNANPCGWLLSFKAARKRQDFRIRGIDGSPDVKVFPPDTSCRNWYDWGGVWTIAVDDEDCTVFVNTIEGSWFKARVRRLR